MDEKEKETITNQNQSEEPEEQNTDISEKSTKESAEKPETKEEAVSLEHTEPEEEALSEVDAMEDVQRSSDEERDAEENVGEDTIVEPEPEEMAAAEPLEEETFVETMPEKVAVASSQDESVRGWRKLLRRKPLLIGVGAVGAVLLAGITVAILFATKVLCIHEWMPATCEQPVTCSRCGDTHGEALGHKWSEATCENPETCRVCGEIQGEALGHDWKAATCEEPKTCERCGETEGKALGHDWKAATCEEPKTCERCGETEGKALGHDWKAATCEEPKTCTRCGETEGSTAAHSWTPATLYAPKTCRVCGKTEGSTLNYDSLGTAYVNVDSDSTLLLREEMSTNSKTLASLADGMQIEVWDCGSSQWYYAKGEGKYGYVNADYVTFVSPSRNNVASSGSSNNITTNNEEILNRAHEITMSMNEEAAERGLNVRVEDEVIADQYQVTFYYEEPLLAFSSGIEEAARDLCEKCYELVSMDGYHVYYFVCFPSQIPIDVSVDDDNKNLIYTAGSLYNDGYDQVWFFRDGEMYHDVTETYYAYYQMNH